MECIGKGKAHAPYEFGVKVSIATTLKRAKGGQFAIHAKALPGNPYDGHTLATIIPDIEKMIGNQLERVLADAGYKGHNAPSRQNVMQNHTSGWRNMTCVKPKTTSNAISARRASCFARHVDRAAEPTSQHNEMTAISPP